MSKICEISQLQIGDTVYYPYHTNDGHWFEEHGEVYGVPVYEQGVHIQGEGWQQYVSKYNINTVTRNGKVIFNDDMTPLPNNLKGD